MNGNIFKKKKKNWLKNYKKVASTLLNRILIAQNYIKFRDKAISLILIGGGHVKIG